MDDFKLDPRLPNYVRNLLRDIETYNGNDLLLPWLRCIKWVIGSLPINEFESVYRDLLELCIKTFSENKKYCNDDRYVQVWIQYADYFHMEAGDLFLRMEALQIGQTSSLYYGAYAIYLEVNEKYSEAFDVYRLGLLRQAKPLKLLEEAYKGFLRRVASRYKSHIMKVSSCTIENGSSVEGNGITKGLKDGTAISLLSNQKVQSAQSPLLELSTNLTDPHQTQITSLQHDRENRLSSPPKPCIKARRSSSDNSQTSVVNPWESNIVDKLISGLKPPLVQYKGFYTSKQKFNGSSSLSLKGGYHNKVLDLGSRRYHLKGCTGQGAFAQIFKASDDQDRDRTVALKVQKPPCPWEYYIYSQLDKRIPKEERASFGRAWKMHAYNDCSIMVCAYGERGTLQDVVNTYLATGKRMDELLCMYYTIEMLRMLEVLHSAGFIHGDFKPDNLLIRNDSDLMEDWAPNRPGHWENQGLCLIDWGRSIDLNLFPPGTIFEGDCKTSGFRCIEMQQQRPWTYQVDTYGLCCIVHVMLHGSYMEVQASSCSDNTQIFKPKLPFKRYHKQEIWDQLFKTLLNVRSCEENPSLGELRRILEEYLMSDRQFPRKIKELMTRQSKIMCSRS